MTNLVYMENSYLTELEAKVLLNQKLNEKYHLILDQTIFYPDGAGGQIGDIGEINGIKVEKSILKKGKIIHITNEEVKGSSVKIKIDWDNRLKAMQQHTSQHLISACFNRLYNIATLSFHASENFISIDLDIEDLDDEKIKNVEELANTIVQNNFKIKKYYPKNEELGKIDFRRDPKVDNNLRVVEIDSFDFAACGGTHLSSTGELGLVKIIDKSRQNGKIRIIVLSGKSSLDDYSIKNNIFSYIGEKLSANENNIKEKFDIYQKQFEEISENNIFLKNNLLDLIKKDLMNSKINLETFSAIIEEFDILPFKDAGSLSKKFEKEENILLFLYHIDKDTVQFIAKATGDINLSNLNTFLKSNYNLRGGGNKDSLQGIFFINPSVNVREIILTEIKNFNLK